jgi:thioredoxin type arsenate reductase
MDRPIRVLFVCTGNSARSQIAEAILRQRGGRRFEVASAGTDPRGVHPLTVRALAEAGIDISGARSRSVDEFPGQEFDYVVTVCDQAREACPVFPGAERSLHWGYDDPVLAEGTEEERLRAFRKTLAQIGERIGQFVPIALREHEAGRSPRRPRFESAGTTTPDT